MFSLTISAEFSFRSNTGVRYDVTAERIPSHQMRALLDKTSSTMHSQPDSFMTSQTGQRTFIRHASVPGQDQFGNTAYLVDTSQNYINTTDSHGEPIYHDSVKYYVLENPNERSTAVGAS